MTIVCCCDVYYRTPLGQEQLDMIKQETEDPRLDIYGPRTKLDLYNSDLNLTIDPDG